MIHMQRALRAWGTDAYRNVLCEEVEQLPLELLPLQQGLRQSSQVSDAPVQAMFLQAEARDGQIISAVSLFYSGVIAGCNCADDPTPVDTLPEQCSIEITIDQQDATTHIRLLPE